MSRRKPNPSQSKMKLWTKVFVEKNGLGVITEIGKGNFKVLLNHKSEEMWFNKEKVSIAQANFNRKGQK